MAGAKQLSLNQRALIISLNSEGKSIRDICLDHRLRRPDDYKVRNVDEYFVS